MSSRGFEFASSLGGSNEVPVIRDWPMAADSAGYSKGDALVLDSSGYADKAAASASTIFAICQEDNTGSVSAADEMKVALVNTQQVWKCSMDASTCTIVKVYNHQLVGLVDHDTLDADVMTATAKGCASLIDTGTDDDGNVMAYVVFTKPAIGQ